MTTVLINEQIPDGNQLLRNIQMYPHIAQVVVNNMDNTPLPFPENELLTHEEFKKHFEKRLFERLGMNIEL